MATKQFYTLLPGEENIIDHEDSGDIQETKGPLSNKKRHPTYKVWTSIILYIIIAALLIIIVIESMLLIRNPALLTPNGLNRVPTVERTTYLPSVYWSENETEADIAWKYISSGHGIVAVKAEYAEQQGLPDSEVWREDSSKRVYVLEAYHSIHCLRRIRSHYLALLHGKRWDWPVEHDMHCLDGLREYVMCNPDDTLLWTTGHGDVGHGQKKMCQDWDALRDWAAERTISYWDYERGFEDETKGEYHSGDGLPVGSF